MRKDLKMGMITGVVIVTIATLIVSVLSPTPEAMLKTSTQSEVIIIGPEDTAPADESAGPIIHVVKAGETVSTIAQIFSSGVSRPH